jgi:hypothetical protein
MRAFLLYLLPVILLLFALFGIGSRRNSKNEKNSPAAEFSDAQVFLKILALGGAIAVGLFAAIELS